MGTKVSKCCKCTNNKTEQYVNGGNSSWTTDDGSKDGEVLPPEPTVRRRMKHTGNIVQLALDKVQMQDAGVYTIAARTAAGTACRDLELRVTAENDDGVEPPAFLRRLNDLSVKIGTRTRFLVELRSLPETTIDWLHNDVLVKEGERYRFIDEGCFHCVDIAPLIAQDAGKWTCRATNDAGSVSSAASLHVLVPKTYKPPEFLEELKILVKETGTVSLECKVVGIPTPSLQWFKDGKEIKAGDVFALNANHQDDSTLGIYTCEAVNCMGKAHSSSRIHVVGGSREGSLMPTESVPIGLLPPVFAHDLQDEFVKIGENFTLSCQVRVPPWPISITWYNSEGKIEDGQTPDCRYHAMADGLGEYLMEVKSAEASDAGEWKCIAGGPGGVNAVSMCQIQMAIPKHYRKPRFMENLKAILTDEGLVSFECKVVGSPTPSLRWFKDGHELKPGDVYQLSGTNSLGSYSCIATNCMGEAISTAELTVEDIQNQLNDEERLHLLMKSQAPKFLHGLRSCDGKINEKFRFVVQVSIAPMPKLAWYRDDHAVEVDAERYLMKVDTSGMCHLDISRLEFVDQAEWKCIASNEFGHTMTSCYLKLIVPKHFKKPRFLECLRAVLSAEGAVNLECKVIGVPQPVLKWYKDGEELKPGDIHKITAGVNGTCSLGTYTCEARNCMGTVSSSASLLGFDDQAKSRAEQHRIELARVPSLSTINEERSSQIYDTPPEGNTYTTMNDHGEITFSFDGKEASVSLYETPDITEEQAHQIIEMYADQLSEHVSAQNIVEMPPMQFVKETSMSGNLLMEAVLVDVSEDYFTSAEEDLRTEADVDEMFSISDESRAFSPEGGTGNGSHPKRPPRKKNDSSKSTYYSLTNNGSQHSENGDESIIVAAELDSESNEYQSAINSGKIQDAYQVAAITETTSLPGDALDNRLSLSPHTTHEIGSDLRVNHVGGVDRNVPRRFRRSRHSSHSSEESRDLHKEEAHVRDLQGEEEDGLVVDPEEQKAKIAQLEETMKDTRQKLRKLIFDIQGDLLKVEEDLLLQSSLKNTSLAANKSLEVLQSIAQPIKDIQMFLVEQHQSPSHISIAEMIAPPIFDLQKNLNIVEKCVEVQGRDHTLIQRTCMNILNKSSGKLQSGFKLIERIALLEKEMIPVKSPGRQTPSKIIQEVLITLQELQAGLNKAHFIIEAKRHLKETKQLQQVDEGAAAKKIVAVLMRFAEPALELKSIISNMMVEIQSEDNVSIHVSKEEAVMKLNAPLKILADEMKMIEHQAIKFTGPKSVYKELHYAILDQISAPIHQLQTHLQEIAQEAREERVEVERLELLESPLEDIFDSLARLSDNLPTVVDIADFPTSSTQEVMKEVVDQVTQLVRNNICRSVQELLYNLDAAQTAAKDTNILEVLRQVSSLQKDFAHVANEVGTSKVEQDILALENLAQPIEMLNTQILQVPGAAPSDVLDDVIACLSILENTVDFDKTALTASSRQLFDTLKSRTEAVKENILMIASDSTMPQQGIDLIADEETAIAKLIELKKCIAIIFSIPCMLKDEDTSMKAEDVKKFVESVHSIQTVLETIQDPAKFEVGAGLEEKVYQSATAVLKSITDLEKRTPILSYIVEAAPSAGLQNISECRTLLLPPLTELSSVIQQVEFQEDPLVALEIPLVEMQNTLETSEFQVDARKKIINSLKNAMEIITIERNNSDIEKEHISQLFPIANVLKQLAVDMSKDKDCIKEGIKFLKQTLKQLPSDAPTKYIAMAVNDVSNTMQRAIQEDEMKISKRNTSERMAKFEEGLAKLEASPSFESKQAEIENLKLTVQGIRPLVSLDPEARKSFENLVSFAQDVSKRSVIFEEAHRKASIIAAELQESAMVSSSNEELNKIQHALVRVFQVPPEVMAALTPIKHAISEIEVHPIAETNRNLMENIQDALILFKISIDKCALKSLSKKDMVLLGRVTDTLQSLAKYLKQEITPEALRSILRQFNQDLADADVDTIKEVLYPVQNLTVQAQYDLSDLIAAEQVRKAERIALISSVSTRTEELAQQVATIKSSRVERSTVIDVQKALYSIQMCANDLIDINIDSENRLVLHKIVEILDAFSTSIEQAQSNETSIKMMADVEATLAANDRQSEINAMTLALHELLGSAPILIEQIGQGHRDAAKRLLVETKFTVPINRLAHVQNPNKVLLDEQLNDVKTNVSEMLETILTHDEVRYIHRIEQYANNMQTIMCTTSADDIHEAIKTIEELVEEIVFAGDNLQESPLQIISANIKTLSNIAIQVLLSISKDVVALSMSDEIESEDNTREVLYYIDDSPIVEPVAIQDVNVNVVQCILSIADTLQHSVASFFNKDQSKAPQIAEIDTAIKAIRLKVVQDGVKPEPLTDEEHSVIDLSTQLTADINKVLPMQQKLLSLKENVRELKSAAQVLEGSSVVKDIASTIAEAAEICIQETRARIIQTQPIFLSLNELEICVKSIEHYDVCDEKRMALDGLNNCIVAMETKLLHEDIPFENLSQAEQSAVDQAQAALSTLTACIHSSDVTESSVEMKAQLVEKAKATIDELRLAVVAVPNESAVKQIMGPLEETAKNVVNLIDNIPEISGFTDTYNPLTGLQMELREMPIILEHIISSKPIASTHMKIVMDISQRMSSLDNAIISFKILAPEDAELVHSTELLLKEFRIHLQYPDFFNTDITKHQQQQLLNAITVTRNIIESITPSANAHNLGVETNNLIIDILKLIEKPAQSASAKILQKQVIDMQDSVQVLQTSIAQLGQVDAKIQRILSNELPRPLAALQFIAESVIVGKSDKLSKDDLHMIELTSECVQLLETALKRAPSEEAVKQYVSLESKLQVILASVNQESLIKDLQEPLQDISRSVEKVVERERILCSEEDAKRRSSLAKLQGSLRDLSEVIARVIEQPDTDEIFLVLEELQKPLRAIVSCPLKEIHHEEIESVCKLNETVELISQTLREHRTPTKVDRDLQSLYETILSIPLESTIDLSAETISFKHAISTDLKELKKALQLTHTVLEKSNSIEDIRQIEIINTPLKNLLKFVLTIKHQRKGNLDLFGLLQDNLYLLQCKLLECGDAKLVDAEVPFLETIGETFNDITSIAIERDTKDLDLEMFSTPLDHLQTNIITICKKVVLTDIPEESVIHRIVELLEKITGGIISMNMSLQERKLVRKTIMNMSEDIEEIENMSRSVQSLSSVIFPLKEIVLILKSHKCLLILSQQELDKFTHALSEIQKSPTINKTIKDCLNIIESNASTLRDKSVAMDEFQKTILLSEPITKLCNIIKSTLSEEVPLHENQTLLEPFLEVVKVGNNGGIGKHEPQKPLEKNLKEIVHDVPIPQLSASGEDIEKEIISLPCSPDAASISECLQTVCDENTKPSYAGEMKVIEKQIDQKEEFDKDCQATYKKSIKKLKFPLYEMHSQIEGIRKMLPDMETALNGVPDIINLLPKLEAFCNEIDSVPIPRNLLEIFQKLQSPCLELAAAFEILPNVVHLQESFDAQKPMLTVYFTDLQDVIKKMTSDSSLQALPTLCENLEAVLQQITTIIVKLQEQTPNLRDAENRETKVTPIRSDLLDVEIDTHETHDRMKKEFTEESIHKEDINSEVVVAIPTTAQITETFELWQEEVAELNASPLPDYTCISQMEPFKILIGSLNELQVFQNECLNEFQVLRQSFETITATSVEVEQLCGPRDVDQHKAKLGKHLMELRERSNFPQLHQMRITQVHLSAFVGEFSTISEMLSTETNHGMEQVSDLGIKKKAIMKLPINQIQLEIKTLQTKVDNKVEPQQAVSTIAPLEEFKARIESIKEELNQVVKLEISQVPEAEVALITDVTHNLHSSDAIEIKDIEIIESSLNLKEHIRELRIELHKEQRAKIADLKLETLYGVLETIEDKHHQASIDKFKNILETFASNLERIQNDSDPFKSVDIQLKNLVAHSRKIQQNILDEESMKQLETPLREFTTAIMTIEDSHDVNSNRIVLCNAAAVLATSIKDLKFSQAHITELIRSFNGELSQIETILQKKDKITLVSIKTPIISMLQRIACLKENPLAATLFTLDLEGPLQEVISNIQQAEESQEEEACNTLNRLNEPFEKLVDIVQRVATVVEKPELAKAYKDKICSETAAVLSDIAKSECTQALGLKLKDITYDLHRAEVSYNVKPIIHELNDLMINISKVPNIAQEVGALTTVQDEFKQFEHLTKCSQDACIATASLSDISESIKQLNVMVHQVSEIKTVKFKKELLNCISSAITAIANVHHKVEVVQIPLNKLNAVLFSLKENFKQDINIDKAKKRLEQVKLPIENVERKLNEMYLKTNAAPVSQKEVVSLVLISEPIQSIRTLIQMELKANELSPLGQQLESLGILQEPLQNLSLTIENVTNLLHQPDLLQAEKNTILTRLQAVKNALNTVVIRAQPVEDLKLKIDQVQKAIELMEYKQLTIKDVVKLEVLGDKFASIEKNLKKLEENAESGNVYEILSSLRQSFNDCSQKIYKIGDAVIDKSEVERISNNFQQFNELQNSLILIDKCINEISSDVVQKSTKLRDNLRNVITVLAAVQCVNEFAQISSNLNHLSRHIVNALKNLDALDSKQRIQNLILESSSVINVLEKNLNMISDDSEKLINMLFGKWEYPLNDIAQSVLNFTIETAPETVIENLNSLIPISKTIATLIQMTCERIDDNQDGKHLKTTLNCVQDNCEAMAINIERSSKNKEMVESIALLQSAMSKLYDALIATKYAEVGHLSEQQTILEKVDDSFPTVEIEADQESILKNVGHVGKETENTAKQSKQIEEPFKGMEIVNNEMTKETHMIAMEEGQLNNIVENEKEQKIGKKAHERKAQGDEITVIDLAKTEDYAKLKNKENQNTTQQKLEGHLRTEKKSKEEVESIAEEEKADQGKVEMETQPPLEVREDQIEILELKTKVKIKGKEEKADGENKEEKHDVTQRAGKEMEESRKEIPENRDKQVIDTIEKLKENADKTAKPENELTVQAECAIDESITHREHDMTFIVEKEGNKQNATRKKENIHEIRDTIVKETQNKIRIANEKEEQVIAETDINKNETKGENSKIDIAVEIKLADGVADNVEEENKAIAEWAAKVDYEKNVKGDPDENKTTGEIKLSVENVSKKKKGRVNKPKEIYKHIATEDNPVRDVQQLIEAKMVEETIENETVIQVQDQIMRKQKCMDEEDKLEELDTKNGEIEKMEMKFVATTDCQTRGQDIHENSASVHNTINAQQVRKNELLRNGQSLDLHQSFQTHEFSMNAKTKYFPGRRGRSPVRERPKFNDQYSDKFKSSKVHNQRFIERKPIFSTPLTRRTATAGTRLKLSCHVISSEELTIEWLKNNCPITNDNNYITFYEDGICSLEILNASTHDTAEYSCTVRNCHGVNTTKAELKVYEGFAVTPMPPTFTRQIREQFRCSSKELILECRLRANPTPMITWYKDAVILTPSDRHKQHYLADGICKLIINNPSVADTGFYSCRAENHSWSDQISHYVNFNGKVDYISQRSDRWPSLSKYTMDSRRPQLSNLLTDACIPAGGALGFQVEVRGSPTEVMWCKEGKVLPKTSPRYKSNIESGVYTLFFPTAMDADKGKYTFKALNAYGKIETSAYVDIVDPAKIHDGRPAMFISRPVMDLTVATGEDITVSCRLCGDPKPNVTLMKGMKDVTNSHRCLKFTSDDYLRFSVKRAREDDMGTYCILAKNRYGCDRAFFTVKLRQRSRSSSPFQLMRSVPEILDVIPRYSERSILRDVPARISSPPTVADTGKNWVSLTWGKPAYRTAAPVLAYKIDAWQKGGETRWIELGMTPTNAFDAFNLIPNGEYIFRVSPRNRYGWGESVQSETIVIGQHLAMPEFAKTLPSHSKALLGTDFTFEVHLIRDESHAQIRWYKNGNELHSSDDSKITLKCENRVCTCVISNMSVADAARYSCEAVSPVGRVESFGWLAIVTDPKLLLADEHLKKALENSSKDTTTPQFIMRLRDRRVKMSYPVRLTCQVAGHPTPMVVWSKDGVVLSDASDRVTWSENSFHTLEFFKTSLNDSGTYGALAKNDFGSVSCRCQLVVDPGIKAHFAPQFKAACSPAELQLREGEHLNLFALVDAHPTVNVIWYRNGTRLRPSRKTVSTLSHDGHIALSVGATTMVDAGVYTCVATNEMGRAETVAKVEVIGKQSDKETEGTIIRSEQDSVQCSREPIFVTKPMNTVANEGDDVVIFCEVIGDPKPEVFWLRDFLKPEYYKDAAHFRRVGDGADYRLEIPCAKLDHTGAYTVLARNCYGETKAIVSLQIKVKDWPKEGGVIRSMGNALMFGVPLQDIRCCDTDAVVFECRLKTASEARVRWERNGKIIQRDGDDFVETFDGKTARLLIADVHSEDEGEYSCVAYNELGKVRTSACLIVDVADAHEAILSEQRLTSLSSPHSRPILAGGHCAPPKFFAIPRTKIATEGSTVRFQCSVGGHPDPCTTWIKDEHVLVCGGRIRVKEQDDVRTLEIRDVTQVDAGKYHVRLSNAVGRVEAAAALDVVVHQVPRMRLSHRRALSAPHYAKIYASNQWADGSNEMRPPRIVEELPSHCRCASQSQVVLTARVHAGRHYDIVWMKDGCVLPNSAQFRQKDDLQGGVQLVIPFVSVVDSGSYRCEVYNVFGDAMTTCMLDVIAV